MQGVPLVLFTSLVPSPSHPSFCLTAVELFLHSCETKAGVGRTGNEASYLPHSLSVCWGCGTIKTVLCSDQIFRNCTFRYFTQGVPVVVFTSLPLCLLGAWHCPASRRTPFWLSLLVVAVHSCLGHKEFRFIFSIVPIGSVYAGNRKNTACQNEHQIYHQICQND